MKSKVLNAYPVRDKILVENTIRPRQSIPLGMQLTCKYNIACLRHAVRMRNAFFYQYHIPNGMINKIVNNKNKKNLK